MKKFLRKIFKRESQLNYIIAEYQPIEINTQSIEVKTTERELFEPVNIDEKKIDQILESLS